MTPVAPTGTVLAGDNAAKDLAAQDTAEPGAQAQDRATHDPDGCGAAYQASVDAVTNASRHAHKRKARVHRDPVGESFIPPVTTPATGSASSYY